VRAELEHELRLARERQQTEAAAWQRALAEKDLQIQKAARKDPGAPSS
jgi:hypothetical protein